jgi:hypothetical protein
MPKVQAEEAATVEAEIAAGTVKRTFNLPVDSVTAIKELANERCTSVTDIIRRAIWIEKFLHDEMKQGGRVFVEFPDNTKKEVVLR